LFTESAHTEKPAKCDQMVFHALTCLQG